MSIATTSPTVTHSGTHHGAPHGAHQRGLSHFLSTYVFSKDHKVIGLQFLFSTLLWFLVGGLLALAVRWQVAWPWSDVPVLGKLFAQQGGQMAPEFYTMLFTMHATVMIFLVIIPILAGAFGNFLIPLMIGADDMAFPTLNMLSYWFMWPAFFAFGASFFVEGGAASGGWTGPTLRPWPRTMGRSASRPSPWASRSSGDWRSPSSPPCRCCWSCSKCRRSSSASSWRGACTRGPRGARSGARCCSDAACCCCSAAC